MKDNAKERIRLEIAKARMARIWWPVWGYSDWRAEVAYRLRFAAYLRRQIAR